ncbi:MAG TPA: SGNH/GDSL hydrolase family protein [Spirochaetota bacterium]|nr:SGNH/GDSL hydrolase family protein [Spirochaetota bacterium]HPI88368.1 SGNH/GDSL hydrolase family protein [Spirochaetota bacterium]HPR46774.1 SGNH/GDSL hydrolase family protein [Spirochaetota bacterium]
MNILFRGGSIAAGKGVDRSYVDILQGDDALSGHVLTNISRPGETSFNCVWSFHEDIGPYRPDVLVLHFGIDDAYFPVYRSEFKENLVQTVRLARSLFDPHIMIMTSHPFDDPYDMDAVNIYYRTIREVAVDLECELVAVHTWWQGYLMEKGLRTADFVLPDTRLPNEKGHELFAACLSGRLARFQKINQILQ